MRKFKLDDRFNVVESLDEATFLFEHIDTAANCLIWRVYTKGEYGLFGGNGEDYTFTIYKTNPSRQEVIEEYRLRTAWQEQQAREEY